MSECRHWRTEVAVGDWHIACSRLLACPPGEVESWEGQPDAGFYLDPGWRDVLLEVPWSARFIDWPDYGVIPLTDLGLLIGTIAHELASGKRVEIACMGGHGRTGTLLTALIGRLEGIDAAVALAAARERYCPKAVETLGQVELVYRALGESPPPRESFARRQ
jgi:hypothetical protein